MSVLRADPHMHLPRGYGCLEWQPTSGHPLLEPSHNRPVHGIHLLLVLDGQKDGRL